MIAHYASNVSIRPGEGGIANRDFHLWIFADRSGSMLTGGKIQALNEAGRNVLPDLRKLARNVPEVRILLGVISFGDDAQVVAEPTAVDQFVWKDIAARNEHTNMGAAFELLARQFDNLKASHMYEPAAILISDGMATGPWRPGLDRMLSTRWGRDAQRFAIAIDSDSDIKMLHEFMGNDPEREPFYASTPEKLCAALRFVTMAGTQAIVNARSQVSGSVLKPDLPETPIDFKPTGDSWVQP